MELYSSKVDQDVLDNESFLGNSLNVESEYRPILETKEETLFFFFRVDPVLYGWIGILRMLYSRSILFISFLSPFVTDQLVGEYAFYAFLFSFVLLPLYQTYSIVDSNSGHSIDCWSCWTLHGLKLCFGKNKLRQKELEYKENQSTEEDPEYIQVTKFMPFSAFNYYYMIRNPGKKLNPALPSELKKIGAMRAFLFYWTCTSEFFLGAAAMGYALKDPVHNYMAFTSVFTNLHAILAGAVVFWFALPWYFIVYNCFLFKFLFPFFKNYVEVPKQSLMFYVFNLAWKLSARQ